MARRKKAAPEPSRSHNGATPVIFVERIERLHGQLTTERSAYMLRCKAVRQNIGEVLDEAKEAGIGRRSLKAVIKARALEAKADAVRENLVEDEDRQSYDNIRVALGDFSDTPLGQAALAGAAGERAFGAPPPA